MNELNSDIQELTRVFGDDFSFGLVCGSLAYGAVSEQSDIDLLFVLKADNADLNLIERRRRFTQQYYDIHRRHGFNSDSFFPGEVISISMLEDSLHYRGFEVRQDRLHLTPVLKESDWSIEKEYCCWLSMMAFNNGYFISGDEKKFQDYRIKANESLHLYFLQSFDQKRIRVEDYICSCLEKILSGERAFLGIKKEEREKFTDDFFQTTPLALMRLQIKGVIQINKQSKGVIQIDNNVYINYRNLMQHVGYAVDNVRRNTFKSKALFNWEEVR